MTRSKRSSPASVVTQESVAVTAHAGDGFAEARLTTRIADRLRQSVVELLEATTQVAELLGAVVHASPEPRHGDLRRRVAELAAQERLPDRLVGAGRPIHRRIQSTAVMPSRSRGFGIARRVASAAPMRSRSATGSGENRRSEAGESSWWRVPPWSVAVHGLVPLEPIAQAKLRDQRDGARVGFEQVVVELLQPHARLDLEAGGQSASQRLALDRP